MGAIALPPAYDAFVSRSAGVPVAGTLSIVDAAGIPEPSASQVVSTGFNDLGSTLLFFDGTAYTVGISPRPGVPMRYMRFHPGFRSAELRLVPGDRSNPFILDSMLRIFFSQIAVLESAFLVHASAVAGPAGAHLFMGRSGTGKSTHSALWLANFEGYRLLNDDNPLVCLLPDGSVIACGTPWSGKTPCWRAASAPLLSMTRLFQAPANSYAPQSDAAAFVAALPGVSVISHCKPLYDRACHTLSLVASAVRVGVLRCLPDADAARLCRRHAEAGINQQSDN